MSAGLIKVEEAIILDYYDGPMSGCLRINQQAYGFECLWSDENVLRKVFNLYAMAEPSYTEVLALVGEFEEKRPGFWYPFAKGVGHLPVTDKWTAALEALTKPTCPPVAVVWGQSFPNLIEGHILLDSEAAQRVVDYFGGPWPTTQEQALLQVLSLALK